MNVKYYFVGETGMAVFDLPYHKVLVWVIPHFLDGGTKGSWKARKRTETTYRFIVPMLTISTYRLERWLREHARLLNREDGALVVFVQRTDPEYTTFGVVHEATPFLAYDVDTKANVRWRRKNPFLPTTIRLTPRCKV